MPATRVAARQEFSGRKLRAAREAAGMSREELAIASGRSAATIADYEIGKFRITLTSALAFAYVLGIEPRDIAVRRAARK
jgi:transcriptional regulator with XRE-family HTH domain